MTLEEKAREIVENAKASESHDVYDVLVIEFTQALREARADALEEAAKECDDWQQFWDPILMKMIPPVSPAHIADRIRSLRGST
jgi:hypothetical protein